MTTADKRPTRDAPGEATLDEQHRLLRHNAEFSALIVDLRGAPPQLGESFLDIVGPRYAPVQHAALSRAREAGTASSMGNGWGPEHRNYDIAITSDPESRDLRLVFRPVDAAKASDADDCFGRALAQNLTELIVVCDVELRARAWNAAYASALTALMGRPLRVGDDTRQSVAPSSLPAWDALCQRALAGESFIEDFEIVLTVGSRMTLEVAMNPVRDEHGAIVGVLMISRNVTKRRDDTRAARATADFRHSVIEALPDAITVIKRDGTIVDYKGSRDVPTVPMTALVGKNVRELRHVPSERILEHLELGFGTREAQRIEYDAVVDGNVRHRDAWIRPINDDEALWVVRDVTVEKAAAQRLAFTERLASLGTLAAGVAHELNNPLQYVLANVELLAEHLAERKTDTPEIRELLSEARDGVERVGTIIASLKAFSRAQDAEASAVDAAKAIGTAVKLAGRKIAAQASLSIDTAESALVVGSEAQLAQVFLNILINAAQALEASCSQGKRITVRTKRLGSDRLAIEISDDGPGIPEPVRARIFDPFFTTKPVGDGTGLGLAIALQIVRASGGDIEVESEEGHGSLFRVVLPIAGTDSTADVLAAAGQERSPEPSCRILVVDDDSAVRLGLARLLSKNRVTTASSAEEALDAFERETFDVVFCDVNMPGPSGVDVWLDVAKRWPGREATIVLMTGGLLGTTEISKLGTATPTILHKPFSRKSLEAHLEETLRATTHLRAR